MSEQEQKDDLLRQIRAEQMEYRKLLHEARKTVPSERRLIRRIAQHAAQLDDVYRRAFAYPTR
jgi:hypothetical protein